MKVLNFMLCQPYKEYHTERFDYYLCGDIYDIDKIEVLCDGDRNITEGYLDSIAYSIVKGEGETDFERIFGFFKLVIIDKTTQIQYFFCDNCGSQRFYFDNTNNQVSDSFLYLIQGIGEKRLNLNAVAQILAYGSVVDCSTVARDIYKTDSECYYEISKNKIKPYSKRLSPFSTLYSEHNLYDLVSAECAMHKGKLLAARLTGGNDSRTVLASILRTGNRPETVITGHFGNPDIPIASKIAHNEGLDIVVLDAEDREERWVEKSYEFFDGSYDPVLSYRQMRAVKSLKEGTELLFGGVGGEFYKNYFIKPFRYKLLFRKSSVYETIGRVFANRIDGFDWLCDDIKEQGSSLIKYLSDYYCERLNSEKNNLALFNHVGFYKLRSSFSDITSSLPKSVLQADVLTDPRMIRSIADKNPVLLAMSVWQRKQIQRDYPSLSEIETDQGYSMTCNPIRLTGERLRKGIFWLSRGVARMRQRIGLSWKDIGNKYWDVDYAAARETDIWPESVDICKEYGILQQDIEYGDIPMDYTGIIILLGKNITTMNCTEVKM